jgi:type VI secretion system protein ImpA
MTSPSDAALDEVLLPLLQPLSADEPCGPAMRYDPLFTEIRLAREEDDPSLPMRQWERPLKKADWPLIDRLCQEALKTRTKDLQLAAWLAESWTRQSGFGGLARGLVLMRELLDRFWEPLHPRIEKDGDGDARVAPLEWINESMPLTLKVHVVLLVLADRKPSKVSMADWERLTASELSGEEIDHEHLIPGALPALTREEVIANVSRHGGDFVRGQLSAVREASVRLAQLAAFLDEKLNIDAPNMGRLKLTLEAIERVLAGMQVQQAAETAHEPDGKAAHKPQPASVLAIIPAGDRPMADDDTEIEQTHPPLVASDRRGGWRSRDEAYAVLESLADYLRRVEPHSPTPYLVHRAVRWGRMPLPELMEEVVREEGDLNQLFKLVSSTRLPPE